MCPHTLVLAFYIERVCILMSQTIIRKGVTAGLMNRFKLAALGSRLGTKKHAIMERRL